MAKSTPESTLVIVESPTKARTIERFLGKGYVVKASNGHIRDLPTSQSEIPEKFKKAPWRDLGVDVEGGFDPLYVVPSSKKAQVRELEKLVKGASLIYLATDEDREGESISWHLLETLKPKAPVKRLVFHEITKDAIERALAEPRDIDMNLVEAQETRRVVDRLYGYRVSPLLWRKMARGLSAGRVQSVAVRLLVERERERIRFRKAGYWGLRATLAKPEGGEAFVAELTHVNDLRVAVGRDFDPETGALKAREGVFVLGREEAEAVRGEIAEEGARVESVEESPYVAQPPAPYVTSTLQQDAVSKLRTSARRAMSVAQQLYENGFITYMRTDSTTLSEEALHGARTLIAARFGPEYVPAEPRQYRTKVRNAQEAHEAIRPAGEAFADPAAVRQALGEDAFRLYDLIWRRTLASQMPDARGTNVVVSVRSGRARLRSSGRTIEFPGFQRAFQAASVEADAEGAPAEGVLPKLAAEDHLAARAAEALERETQPSARYTEGSLIRELERLGIGRPSTWATIVDLVLERAYAFKRGTALVPTFTAMAVVALLEEHFGQLCDYEFTAKLEDELDAIARGEADRVGYLNRFYFGDGRLGLNALVEQGEVSIDPRKVCGVPLGETPDGTAVEVRIGRYGPFLSAGELRASVPEEQAPDELTVERAMEILQTAARGPEALGHDPASGLPVYLKAGRYGPYVQLGDAAEGAEKPKMASLLAGMKPDTVTFEAALALLSLPREIGAHPDSGLPVTAANGRFGPFVKCGEEIRSIPADAGSPLDIGLEQAVELLRQPKGRRTAPKLEALRELGAHPESGQPLKVMSGRYGPYVTDGELNASLPRGTKPEELNVAQALELLRARAEKLAETGGKPARRGARKTAKKAAKKNAKKAARKKT